MDNYPDDIQRFNDDPRSPLYDGPEGDYCQYCGEYTDYDDMVEGETICKECGEDD